MNRFALVSCVADIVRKTFLIPLLCELSVYCVILGLRWTRNASVNWMNVHIFTWLLLKLFCAPSFDDKNEAYLSDSSFKLLYKSFIKLSPSNALINFLVNFSGKTFIVNNSVCEKTERVLTTNASILRSLSLLSFQNSIYFEKIFKKFILK